MALNRKSRIEDAEAAAHESSESGEKSKEYKNPYDVGERPAEGGKPLREWKRRVKKARKILRRDLREKGIRRKQEFEQIAWEMGLTLDGKKNLLLLWWGWLRRHFNPWALLAAALGLLLLLFLLSNITDHEGAFTVTLSSKLHNEGFNIYEDRSFTNPSYRLRSEMTKDISNISLSDVPKRIDETDGSHNGENYVAFSFYVRNDGDEAQPYHYDVRIGSSSLGVTDAVWLMVFVNGKQTIYASEAEAGVPEEYLGYDGEPPFYALAENPELQYYQENGSWGVRPTPFASADSVVNGDAEALAPGEENRYTVVIWLEGNDEDCVDEIFGGHATYSMEFTVPGEGPIEHIGAKPNRKGLRSGSEIQRFDDPEALEKAVEKAKETGKVIESGLQSFDSAEDLREAAEKAAENGKALSEGETPKGTGP